MASPKTLTERDIAELGRFYALRFPAYEDRIRLATALGVASEAQLAGDPLTAWTDVVRLCAQRGRLDELGRMAARASAGSQEHVARRLGLVILAVAVIAALVFVSQKEFDGEKDQPDEPEVAPVTAPAPVLPAPSPASPPAVAPPSGPLPSAPNAPEATAEAEVAPAEPVAVAPDPDSPPGRESLVTVTGAAPPDGALRRPNGRCSGASGSIVGWWYSHERPGNRGDIVQVKSGANVRADYPRRENRWKVEAPYVCGLLAGDRVRIGGEPQEMPGGDWWIPLAGGELLER
jgi:hypothetical protein